MFVILECPDSWTQYLFGNLVSGKSASSKSVFFFQVSVREETHTHAHTHAHTHTHSHTRMDTHAHTHAHTLTHTHIHTLFACP